MYCNNNIHSFEKKKFGEVFCFCFVNPSNISGSIKWEIVNRHFYYYFCFGSLGVWVHPPKIRQTHTCSSELKLITLFFWITKKWSNAEGMLLSGATQSTQSNTQLFSLFKQEFTTLGVLGTSILSYSKKIKTKIKV